MPGVTTWRHKGKPPQNVNKFTLLNGTKDFNSLKWKVKDTAISSTLGKKLFGFSNGIFNWVTFVDFPAADFPDLFKVNFS